MRDIELSRIRIENRDLIRISYEVWFYDDYLGMLCQGKNGKWSVTYNTEPCCEEDFIYSNQNEAIKKMTK